MCMSVSHSPPSRIDWSLWERTNYFMGGGDSSDTSGGVRGMAGGSGGIDSSEPICFKRYKLINYRSVSGKVN